MLTHSSSPTALAAKPARNSPFRTSHKRSGVERSQEPRLRRLLHESKAGRIRAAGIRAGIAVALQSSTAVAMLAAGYAGSGALTVATGLALLGADLGSALVLQILSIDIQWVVPPLLIAGGLLFFNGWNRDVKQGGAY
jgi:phosphate:Na+ symporter